MLLIGEAMGCQSISHIAGALDGIIGMCACDVLSYHRGQSLRSLASPVFLSVRSGTSFSKLEEQQR